tara:strand:- start:228 stop:386 length:159 start_codon:yes stop_codon:yes gene_type:complete
MTPILAIMMPSRTRVAVQINDENGSHAAVTLDYEQLARLIAVLQEQLDAMRQ